MMGAKRKTGDEKKDEPEKLEKNERAIGQTIDDHKKEIDKYVLVSTSNAKGIFCFYFFFILFFYFFVFPMRQPFV